jgi:steroid delta-isomerase-like uncharacterized protein
MSEDLIALAREEVDSFNAGDFDRMRALLAPGCVYDEAATGMRAEGPDAVIEVNEGWRAAFPDATGTVTDVFACGDRVAVEITWEGTQSGALALPGGGEIPPSNRRATVRACQVMTAAEGKFTEIHHYFDMLGMLEQLGTVSAESLAHAG